jgi:hypothetical protein
MYAPMNPLERNPNSKSPEIRRLQHDRSPYCAIAQQCFSPHVAHYAFIPVKKNQAHV